MHYCHCQWYWRRGWCNNKMKDSWVDIIARPTEKRNILHTMLDSDVAALHFVHLLLETTLYKKIVIDHAN